MEWIVFGRHCKRLWKAVETKHLSAPRIKWIWSLGKFILPTYPWRVKLLKQIFQVVPPVAGEDNLLTWSNKTSRNALTVLGTVKFQKLSRNTGWLISASEVLICASNMLFIYFVFYRVVDIFPDLLLVLPADKLASSFAETISKIPKRDSDFGEHKLKCLSKLINSPLFLHQGEWLAEWSMLLTRISWRGFVYCLFILFMF